MLIAGATLAACGDSSEAGGGGAGGVGGAASEGGSGGAGGVPAEIEACDGATTRGSPLDTSLPGAYPVGARTVQIGALTAEVFYPATAVPDGAAKKTYDLRTWLPDSEKSKISDDKAPIQTCECYDDLELDGAHGPYPIVFFVHGTAGYRAQSLEIVEHWASRGMVVIAADHPGLYLGDLIRSICGQDAPTADVPADLAALVSAVQAPAGDIAFLAGHVDATRIGMTGHSAGGAAVSGEGDAAQVIIPMAAGGAEAGSSLVSTLVLGAVEDTVVSYASTQEGYADTPPKKRFAGISPGGHLVFSSLCSITNADGEDIVTVGQDADVCGLSLAGALFDCSPDYVTAERGTRIVNDVTTAVLEETLLCQDRSAWISTLPERFPEIKDFDETLE